MSSYTQPSKSLSVFNSGYFLSEDATLTESLGDQRYVKLQGVSNIAGSLTLSGNLTCFGTSTITGNLNIANATVGNLIVTQNLSTPTLTSLINSNITVNNTLTTLRSNVSNLQVLSQLLSSNSTLSTFTGNLSVGTGKETGNISYTLGYDNSANTAIKKFGTGSINFTNTLNSSLIIKGITSSLIGTANFTIECWMYVNSVSTTPSTIFSAWDEGYCDLSVYVNGGQTLWLWKLGTTGTGTLGWNSANIASFQLNTWTHFAFMYNSSFATNKYRYFINGVAITVGGNSSNTIPVANLFNSTQGVCFGARYNNGNIDNRLNGFIDEIRISNTNRYGSTGFTPPTTQFTSDSFTLLLNRMDSSFLFDSHITPTPNTVVGVSLDDGQVTAYKGLTATMGDIACLSNTASLSIGGTRVLTSSNVSVNNITPPSSKLSVIGTLVTTGSIGVGTTNASNTLHVVGSSYTTSSMTVDGVTYAKGGIDFSSGASGHLGADGCIYKFGGEPYIAADNYLFISNTSGNQRITFRTDYSTGRIGIGTSSPAYPLDIVGQNTNSQYTNPSMGKYFSRNASITSMGSTNTFNTSICTTGSIWINSLSGDSLDNSFVSGNSDRRIKENIIEINTLEALNQIRKLRPVYYDYIDRHTESYKNIGFIAQEVKDIVPQAVDATKEKFIPNVFKFAKWYSKFIGFDAPHGLTGTGKLQVILKKNDDEEDKKEWIFTVFNELILEVSETRSSGVETIFVYGSWVKDFHILADKPISIVAISAIQELDKRISRIEKFLELN